MFEGKHRSHSSVLFPSWGDVFAAAAVFSSSFFPSAGLNGTGPAVSPLMSLGNIFIYVSVPLVGSERPAAIGRVRHSAFISFSICNKEESFWMGVGVGGALASDGIAGVVILNYLNDL